MGGVGGAAHSRLAHRGVWLPKGEGHVIGEKIFDLFTYNNRTSLGYAQLRQTHDQTRHCCPPT